MKILFEHFKAQSAMEYLMTYGWAILLIAIVLVAFFTLGVFKPNKLTSSACVAQTGFLCSQPVLSTNGILQMEVGVNNGQQLSVIGDACTNSSNIPTQTSFTDFYSNMNLNPGVQYQFTFQCPLTSNIIGTPFTGKLWLLYDSASTSNQIMSIGTVSSSITTSNSIVLTTGGIQPTVPSTYYIPSGGYGFQYISFLPSGSYFYLSALGSGDFLNISTTSYNVANTLFLSSFAAPYSLAFSSSGNYAYVVNTGGYNGQAYNGNMLIINMLTNTVVNTIESTSFNSPLDIALSGSYAYITNEYGDVPSVYDGNILIISTSTNSIVGSITSTSFNAPRGISISPDGSYAYVVNSGGYNGQAYTGNILIISLISNSIIGSIESPAFSSLYDVAIAPSGTYAYVTNSNGQSNGANMGNILIINTALNSVVGSIEPSTAPSYYGLTGIAFSPSGANAYVASPNQQAAPSGFFIINNN